MPSKTTRPKTRTRGAGTKPARGRQRIRQAGGLNPEPPPFRMTPPVCCATCRHCKPDSNQSTGECHLEPPLADEDKNNQAVWPGGLDINTDFCGQWEVK